jgi:succinate dehydrogenase / fumarate reductase cytochrome b subunit
MHPAMGGAAIRLIDLGGPAPNLAPPDSRRHIKHEEGSMTGAPSPDDRPIAPHLSIWRWHATMASSILHRLSGIALYGAAIGLALWLMAAAAGPEAYAPAAALLVSPLGQIALYLVVAALAYHLVSGIRHLVFDTGAGLTPSDADTSAWFAILFAVAAPIGLWALLTFGA